MTTAEQQSNLEELLGNLGEEVTTAFLVYQTTEGQWVAEANYSEKNFTLQRQAVLDDFIGGTSAVHAGASAQQTAMFTMLHMDQRARAVQQQMQQQQEASRISQLIDPSKLRVK